MKNPWFWLVLWLVTLGGAYFLGAGDFEIERLDGTRFASNVRRFNVVTDHDEPEDTQQ